jgi:hypothetical protein
MTFHISSIQFPPMDEEDLLFIHGEKISTILSNDAVKQGCEFPHPYNGISNPTMNHRLMIGALLWLKDFFKDPFDDIADVEKIEISDAEKKYKPFVNLLMRSYEVFSTCWHKLPSKVEMSENELCHSFICLSFLSYMMPRDGSLPEDVQTVTAWRDEIKKRL